MREPVTEQTIQRNRKLAEEQPATGLAELAQSLMDFGWQIDREQPSVRIPYFEEAAAIYRSLVADGAEEHLNAAAHALSSLGLQYSLAHADELSLAAKHEAADLTRRFNLRRESAQTETRLLMELGYGLAEAAQFAQAVAVQREVVAIYHATETDGGHASPDSVMWSLLDLAIYLELAGQTDASLEIECEALTLKRRMTDDTPGSLAGLAIWTAGASLRFASIGHHQDARGLLDEAIAACERLPAEGDRSSFSFGFHQAVQAALFARSGTADEQAPQGRTPPVGVDPQQVRQPVPGLSFHHWAFSVRQTYRTGYDAINEAIAATADPPPDDPDVLAEFGILLRRRNIRASVLFNRQWPQFLETITPKLQQSVDVERRLLAAAPGQDPQRLIRALTDQALGHLVTCSNAKASDALRQASHLYTTIGIHPGDRT